MYALNKPFVPEESTDNCHRAVVLLVRYGESDWPFPTSSVHRSCLGHMTRTSCRLFVTERSRARSSSPLELTPGDPTLVNGPSCTTEWTCSVA